MEGDCILPDDLVMHILSKLSVQTLLRFRSVSKEWCALIDSPYFISKHYQVQYSIRTVTHKIPHIVHDAYTEKLALLSVEQGDVSTFVLSDDLERDSKVMFPWKLDSSCGCVNGIVCLMWKKIRCWKKRLSLWNPATREFKSIACPEMPRAVFEVEGFGFDLLSEDFKILGGYTLVNKDKWGYRCYELYSLKNNSWKSLRPPLADVRRVGADGYLNGVFYWESRLQQVNGERLVIVSFNFSSEDFKVSDPPQDACLWSQTCYQLQIMVTLYKESIALFVCHEDQENFGSYRVNMWVVTQFDDCGVPLSWQHSLSVIPTPSRVVQGVDTTLINGDILLSVSYCNCRSIPDCSCDPECCIYKTSTSELTKLRKNVFSDFYKYVESLFPLSKRYLNSTFQHSSNEIIEEEDFLVGLDLLFQS